MPRLAAIAVVLCAVLLGSAAATAAAPVAPEIRGALPQLKRKTKLPILLPSKLPYARASNGQKLNFAVAGNARSWSVSLFYGRTCGANACTVGAITAGRGGKPYTGFRRVGLAKGLHGYFKPTTCGASCSPPTIEWVYRRVLYRIELAVDAKGARERALVIGTANSAINAGPR